MMKFRIIVPIVMIIVLFCGCENSEIDSTEINKNFEYVDEISQDDIVYEFNTDDQPDTANKVYTSDGIYSIDYSEETEIDNILTFYDYQTKQVVPVCNKANCSHNTKDCNAVFSDSRYPSLINISYYNENLYVMAQNDGYLCLERISLDGSSRNVSCEFARVETDVDEDEDGMKTTSTYYPNWIIHRGYAYYATSYPGSGKAELMRVKLDSEEKAEVLYSMEGEYPELYRVRGYGNGIYFQMGNYTDDSMTDIDAALYVYNVDTGKISEVASDVIKYYTIGENVVFYFDEDDNITKYDVLTKKRKVFCETEKGDYGSQYTLFIKNDKFYYIYSNYDKDMNEIVHEYEYSFDGQMLATYEVDDIVTRF